MKFLVVLISALFLPTQSLELSKVRLAYKEAAQDPTKVEAFYNTLTQVSKSDKMALLAYKGASITLKARNAKSLKEKKDGFIEGIELIEYTILTEPNNIEPRFVRIGIQENTPKILKYKANIPEDKAFILKQFNYISSKNLKGHIKDYILQSSLFTNQEKQTITNQ